MFFALAENKHFARRVKMTPAAVSHTAATVTTTVIPFLTLRKTA